MTVSGIHRRDVALTDRRYLIVNADDFGLSPGINRGVIKAHQQGIVTSTSLMVRWPAAEVAALLARGQPHLSVGLHVDLGEWAYRDGGWVPVYERVPLDNDALVAAEVTLQLAAFRRLLGQDPTHIDSHQHVHRSQPLRSILAHLAQELGVPLRQDHPSIRYCGAFYGQDGTGASLASAITPTVLIAILEGLHPGVTELACHPALGDDTGSTYGAERDIELATLCDPRVQSAVSAADIALCSFRNIIHSGLQKK